jgi:FKBP-type peptidyl-prolyl cis-trans isomerase
VGMRVGGRRELIIPPDLAYGAQGAPPDIGPNEPLVFVIDLLAAR